MSNNENYTSTKMPNGPFNEEELDMPTQPYEDEKATKDLKDFFKGVTRLNYLYTSTIYKADGFIAKAIMIKDTLAYKLYRCANDMMEISLNIDNNVVDFVIPADKIEEVDLDKVDLSSDSSCWLEIFEGIEEVICNGKDYNCTSSISMYLALRSPLTYSYSISIPDMETSDIEDLCIGVIDRQNFVTFINNAKNMYKSYLHVFKDIY